MSMLRIDTRQAIEEHVARGRRRRSRDNKLSDLAEAIIARPKEQTLPAPVLAGLVQVFEALMLALIGAAIYVLYIKDELWSFYALVIISCVITANVLFNMAQTHSIAAYRNLLHSLWRVAAAWSAIILLVLAGVFFFKASDALSRVWVVCWFFSGGFTLILFRVGLRMIVRNWARQGKFKRRAVIVGGGAESSELIAQIRSGAKDEIELFGLFDDRIDERSPDEVDGCPKLGNVSDLVDFARRTQVDIVIVSMPLSAEKRVLDMLKRLWVLPVDIRLSTHMSRLKFKSTAYSYIGAVPVLDIANRPISNWNLVFKWVFDKTVAITALILLSPVMIITAIAIKLESKGPVLFRQKRHGFNNELIEIYKFRSMYTDASDAAATKLVTKDDPRVTRVGRFIRKTSIDELPQLFNVLKNELSIVGPRPHALQAKAANQLYNEAVDGYFARHRVKPGMTGWAQIHGWRGETDTVDKIMGRVNFDLYYIENWTPFLDFYVLLMTPFSLFSKNENAY
jgi:Undecaprenyl-phosphate glucose phosphotransferase